MKTQTFAKCLPWQLNIIPALHYWLNINLTQTYVIGVADDLIWDIFEYANDAIERNLHPSK